MERDRGPLMKIGHGSFIVHIKQRDFKAYSGGVQEITLFFRAKKPTWVRASRLNLFSPSCRALLPITDPATTWFWKAECFWSWLAKQVSALLFHGEPACSYLKRSGRPVPTLILSLDIFGGWPGPWENVRPPYKAVSGPRMLVCSMFSLSCGFQLTWLLDCEFSHRFKMPLFMPQIILCLQQAENLPRESCLNDNHFGYTK